jgi:hypothetical protein
MVHFSLALDHFNCIEAVAAAIPAYCESPGIFSKILQNHCGTKLQNHVIRDTSRDYLRQHILEVRWLRSPPQHRERKH